MGREEADRKEVREKKMKKREEEDDRDEEEQILWVLNAWKNIFLDDVRQPTALDVGIIAKEQSYLSVTAIIRHEPGGFRLSERKWQESGRVRNRWRSLRFGWRCCGRWD